MITLRQLRAVVGQWEIPAIWERNIPYAASCFPEGEIPFLTQSYLQTIRERIILSEHNARIIADAMDWVRESDGLRNLFWLWHCILFRRPDSGDENSASWPVPPDAAAANGDKSNVFPAIVLLSGYPRLLELYERRRIPESVIADTLSAVEKCLELYKERTGRDGFGTFYMQWLLHQFHGKLYKLGRLEYEMTRMGPYVRVYRHMRSGRRMAFSEPGIAYREDGLVDGTNGIFDAAGSWLADFDETAQGVEGCPVASDGRVQRMRVSIPKREWRLALAPGDAALSIHIPGGGKLAPELCGESLSQAIAFFAAHYPETPFRAFFCGSWMLDPQLRLLLEASSNLVQFQRRFDLFPIPGTDEGLYRFVFNCDRCEIGRLPEKSSLQVKIKRFMASGGHMHTTGGYMLLRGNES